MAGCFVKFLTDKWMDRRTLTIIREMKTVELRGVTIFNSKTYVTIIFAGWFL